MKKVKIIFLSLVILVIVLSLVFFNYEKDVASTIDNRMLYELDDLSFDSINNYMNDRIGFREKAISVYNTINKNIFGVMTHPEYIIGNDNENFFAKIDYKQVYTDYYEHFLDAVKEIQDYCEDRDVKFYFVIDPSKANILEELLPNSINFDNSWIDEFINSATAKDINIIQKYDYFNSIKDTTTLFDKQYDVHHWNDTGAFLGTNYLLDDIKKDFPSIDNLKLSDYEVVNENRNYIADSNYSINENIDKYYLKEDVTDLSDEYRQGLNLNEEFTNYFCFKSSNNNKPTILGFLSSYYMSSDRAEKFLASQASTLYAVHNYQNIYNISYYLNTYNPDLVIFEIGDYTFAEYYFSEYYMETMNLQPSLKEFDYKEETTEAPTHQVERKGMYTTYIIKNPSIEFDYAYYETNDGWHDCIKYDNENMFITVLSENEESIKNATLKYVNKNREITYVTSLFEE